MYFGSVRFFKLLIVSVVCLIIIGLSITTICISISNKHYKDKVQTLETANKEIESELNSAFRDVDPITYQLKYPELYVTFPNHQWVDSSKTVYLTFDDGPSERTSEILDILKEKNIKATFFVVGKTSTRAKQIMQRIVKEGHTIAVHTFSHEYREIYQSVDAFLDDFNKEYELIYENTGVKPELFRFPGGSINTYNMDVYKQISSEMLRRGFLYYDWNASSEDASGSETKYSVYATAVSSASNKDKIILLMHDSENKHDTVENLPKIIDKFQAEGYKFDKLTKNVKPIVFDYNE